MLKLKVSDFISMMERNELIPYLKKSLPRMNSAAETIAWEHSFTQVSILFQSLINTNKNISNVDIILEYHLPLSSKYCDLIIVGKKNDQNCCYIVELKHWLKNDSDKPSGIKGTIYHKNVLTVHPSQQVGGYREYIQNFHSAFTESLKPNVAVGVVFFTTDISIEPYTKGTNAKLAEDYPLYSLNNIDELKTSILENIDSPSEAFAESIIHGTYRQNRSMLVGFANMLQNFEKQNASLPYVLLDEQNTGFEHIVSKFEEIITKKSDKKEVIIIKGNPGSGKSAVAINTWLESILIAKKHNIDPHKNIAFCTTSDPQYQAWANVMKKSGVVGIENAIIKASKFNPGINANNINNLVEVLSKNEAYKNILYYDTKGKKYRIDPLKWRDTVSLLKSGQLASDGFIYNNMDEFLLVFVDEAHGLMQPVDESDENNKQIIRIGSKDIPPAVGPMSYHIIDHSKISVFFIDGQQAYRDKESTRDADIERYAKELNANLTVIDLADSEYRCGGSADYVEWVKALFEHPENMPSTEWKQDFSLDIVDYPSEMETILRKHLSEGSSTRFMAYYSVEWKTKTIEADPKKYELDDTKKDFCLPDKDNKLWAKCWNSSQDYIAPREDHKMYSDPLLEVGYPLVVRGFDFDYVGVIWLDDLIYRNGTWCISLEHTKYDKGPSSLRKAAITAAGKGKSYISLTENNEEINKYCRSIFGNYLVILTRAIKGNVLYIKDKDTREYIRNLLGK